jgi:hypothetical protein
MREKPAGLRWAPFNDRGLKESLGSTLEPLESLIQPF